MFSTASCGHQLACALALRGGGVPPPHERRAWLQTRAQNTSAGCAADASAYAGLGQRQSSAASAVSAVSIADEDPLSSPTSPGEGLASTPTSRAQSLDALERASSDGASHHQLPVRAQQLGITMGSATLCTAGLTCSLAHCMRMHDTSLWAGASISSALRLDAWMLARPPTCRLHVT